MCDGKDVHLLCDLGDFMEDFKLLQKLFGRGLKVGRLWSYSVHIHTLVQCESNMRRIKLLFLDSLCVFLISAPSGCLLGWSYHLVLLPSCAYKSNANV